MYFALSPLVGKVRALCRGLEVDSIKSRQLIYDEVVEPYQIHKITLKK